MATPKTGTQKLTALVLGFVTLGNQIGISLADGYQKSDLGPIFGASFPALSALGTLPEVREEIKNLDAEERKELFTKVKDEFSLPDNPSAERKVEWALTMIEHIWDGVDIFKPKATEEPGEQPQA